MYHVCDESRSASLRSNHFGFIYRWTDTFERIPLGFILRAYSPLHSWRRYKIRVISSAGHVSHLRILNHTCSQMRHRRHCRGLHRYSCRNRWSTLMTSRKFDHNGDDKLLRSFRIAVCARCPLLRVSKHRFNSHKAKVRMHVSGRVCSSPCSVVECCRNARNDSYA